ncbi:MAG TPA: EAL domain-containing protein [Mycobacteriales bacterium]|jgi:diguanylate cyclase (GGDEF)-like protein|nr:EAL domain-containing protein [Mycobacteriales bacterium]
MAGWEQRLTDIETGEFVALFGLAVWQWRRYRARGAGWAIWAFGLIAAIAVLGQILPRVGVLLPPMWVLKIMIGSLLLVPYALYRFAASFAPVRGWARHLAEVLTAGVLIGTVLLPYLPYPGQVAPSGWLTYRIVLTLQWGLLFGFVAVRMWRAGSQQPRAARNRMRLLAIAAAGLDLPVIISTLALANRPWMTLASEINTVVMGVLFALGLVLPSVVRSWWRSGERNAMQVAVADLVSAYSAEDVAGGLLPHVAALTGASDVTLVDATGAEVARYRAARIPVQRKPEEGTNDDACTVPIEVAVGRTHRLVVRTDPYLPFFARNEFRALKGLAEYVGLAIDRCELLERERAAQAQLAYQAMHDALTGLPNRAFFTDRLTEALARSGRRSSVLAVMFLDLDRFKLVNDGLDHAAGDQVLAETARRLLATARAGDTVARFGGDEFTVLAEVGNAVEALGLADRFRSAISEPIFIGERDLSIGASIGVVVTGGGDDPLALIRDADAAMYRAKESGRDRVVMFGTQIRGQARIRLDIERELRHAIASEEISAVYQPVVDLRSGVITGVEALARWDHPTRGRLTPDKFLGVAEESGLILPMGEQVLTLACAQARHWTTIADPGFKVWVNVSARQFADPGLRDSVVRILDEAGLAPSALGIEITESILMAPTDLVAEQFRQLRECGVSIAVDDFGTGFSSLSYLARFPVDRLKIDRSFVVGIGTEPSTSLLTACLAMGRSLALTTVAEGVETVVQADWLTGAGCDEVQGYLYARPLNAHQISNLLTHPHQLGEPPALLASQVRSSSTVEVVEMS